MLIALLLLPFVAACSNRPPDNPEDYVKRIEAARAAKDADFQKSSDSPVPENKKADLLPLAYYPIDPEYNVAAALTPATDQAPVMMPTSTGVQRRMRNVGTLVFTLKGTPMTLLAMDEADAGDMNRITVMFSDLTNGSETYDAGRYIDLDRTGTGIYALDFNTAYHPYCYYNASYECPLPPPENRLETAIRAGERKKPSPSVELSR